MGINEHSIEKYLNSSIVALGGKTYKWVSPGKAGVPDQIVMLNGKIYFLELKTRKGKVSSTAQIRRLDEIRKQGFYAKVIWGYYDVDMFLKEVADAKS